MIIPDLKVKTFDMINQNTATTRFDRESFGIKQIDDYEDTHRLSTLLRDSSLKTSILKENVIEQS